MELLLVTLAIRDVAGNGRSAGYHPALILDSGDCERDVDSPSVFSQPHRLQLIDALTVPDPFKNPEKFVLQLRWNQSRNVLPYYFAGTVAVHLFGAGIPAFDRSIQSLAQNCVIG